MKRALGLAFLLACGAGTPQQPAQSDPARSEPAKQAPAPEKQQEPFATPKAKPPPAPDGAVLLDPPLYVQRCDPAHPCTKLLQPAGETHCRQLKLGATTGWRLPDRHEVKRFTAAELADVDGFHWTRTAFDQDPAQAWIVDPKSGKETTIPRNRKPFTIRCVLDP